MPFLGAGPAPPRGSHPLALSGVFWNNVHTSPVNVSILQVGPPPAPTLGSHTTTTSESFVIVTGTAPGAVSIDVSSPGGMFQVPVIDAAFSAAVPLAPNQVNQVFFTATSASGLSSAPSATSITHDAQPPELFIDFPANGATLTNEATDVAGRVSDMLSGFMGLNVTVNGVAATVNIGIGTNGTFFAPAVPLALGPNTITAVATDALGNATQKQITVTRVEIPPGAPLMQMISGNGQSAQVLTPLTDPIVVKITHSNGNPFVNKVVTFHVTRSDGRLGETASAAMNGSMMLQVHTDTAGEARAFWRLGSDSGMGNNRVEVTSTSIVGTTFFCASATPGPASQMNIGSGNNQRVEVGAPAPEPLRVKVSDGCNGVAGVLVTFTVTQGCGKVNGLDSITVDTATTGHAEVTFTLGPNAGNQRVLAALAANPSETATFVIYGVQRDESQPTSLSGLVLDNAGQPIGGATCTLIINGATLPTMQTDVQGQFSFSGVPAGPGTLRVDGLTANLLNGQTIPQNSFPALQYELVLVPNGQNSLPRPVVLPRLNPSNVRSYSTTQDTELSVEGIEGLRMMVTAGSMTIDNGTGQFIPAPDGTAIFLNQVHHDDVPMPMPDGAAPPFAWTLQPRGARFDPPVKVIYPNMSGLPAGSIAYFLSFNHDTNRFEIIASGHVTNDGACIETDPGDGIDVAGWGCNCPPYSVATDCCRTGADLDIDSDNNGAIAAEDAIETEVPGKYICLNDDDDDQNGIPDKDDLVLPASDDDLVFIELSVSGGCVMPGDMWRLTYPAKLRVWQGLSGPFVLVASGALKSFPVPGTLFVEGIASSSESGDVTLTLDVLNADGIVTATDTVLATVIKADLDVDSDNSNNTPDFGPQRNDAEDDIEDRDDLPGKILCVNNDDDDLDNVVDFGDGYNLDGLAGNSMQMADDANAIEDDFVKMVFEIPAPANLGVANVKVTYSASDPATATINNTPPGRHPSDGRLRIWTKNGNVVRKKEKINAMPPGDFVAEGIYKASDFGLTNAMRTVDLWLEGIRPSPTTGGDRILFEIDPDGDGPATFQCADAVRVTVCQVEFLDQAMAVTDHADIGHFGADSGTFGGAHALDGYTAAPGNALVNGAGGTFIDTDPDRFFIRVTHAPANVNPGAAEMVEARIATVLEDGTLDDSDDFLDLLETGVNTGVFVSEALLLMSPDLPAADNPDDVHPVYSVHAGATVTDGSSNDRTHRATVDGRVRVTFGAPAGAMCRVAVPVCDRVPMDQRRTLNVRVTVLNEPAGVDISGDGVINSVLGPQAAATAYVDAQVARANLAWAQACIKVVRPGAIRFLAAPAPGGVNIIADSSFNGGDHNAVATDAALSAGVAANVLEVYFVANIAGANAFTVTPECGNANFGANTYSFIGVTGGGAPVDLRFRTVAHEIGHALDNLPNQDAAQPPYIYYPAGVTVMDNMITQYRRIRHDTEMNSRIVRPAGAGNLGMPGNTLLSTP